MKTIPQFVYDALRAFPVAHGERHRTLYCIARQLHHHRSEQDIITLLEIASAKCDRVVSRKEIEDAVCASKATAWKPGERATGGKSASKWPAYDPEAARAIATAPDAPTVVGLWEMSPFSATKENGTEEIIDLLFPGNPFLCAGWSKNRSDTRLREEWRGKLARMPLIVPSPMTARTGTNQKGETSKRCLNNTGPRTFLVLDFDEGDEDQQAACAWHLADIAPLVMVVRSGGKSLHAWFSCKTGTEDDWHRFLSYACTLGGDSAGWTRCQLMRMPNGRRTDKEPLNALQTVLYFNPAII